MVRQLSLLSVSLIALGTSASAAVAPSMLGNWARQDGTTRVKITKCGADFCAANTWVRDPKGDEAVGDKLVMSVKPKSSSDFEGEAFDKKRNLHYSMKISLQQSSMTTHGCVLGGIVCKDATWTRIK